MGATSLSCWTGFATSIRSVGGRSTRSWDGGCRSSTTSCSTRLPRDSERCNCGNRPDFRGAAAIVATDVQPDDAIWSGQCVNVRHYLPDPPAIVGLEEPDRGIHPRLLRDVRDAMYRLAYPESVGEKRDPVQVIATTHSPYMLDLFRDHPEEIVIADKVEDNVRFQRLSDLPNIEEILRDSQLGDVWYTGILGGVPTDR